MTPQVTDPIGAVIHGGQNPDAVFGKVRMNGEVRLVGTKTADRPIDYLARRLPERQRISEAQFRAAEQFLADYTLLMRLGSNTANIGRHLENAYMPTPQERAAMADGQFMRVGAEVRPVKQDDLSRVYTAMRVQRVAERMDRFDYALLTDLIIHEYPVGIIAQRIGLSPEAAGALVRVALWRLVSVLDATSAEFAAWMAMVRQTGETPEVDRTS